ncbi:hypothetical protein CY34DRAFT_109403, partial [Suillus luteus UH-Slu-Lm8-n1]
MMRIHSQMQQSQSSEGETDDDSKLEKHISSSVEEEFREPQKGKRRAASKRKKRGLREEIMRARKTTATSGSMARKRKETKSQEPDSVRYSSTKNSDEELVPVASETRSCSTSASASSRSNATMPTFEGDKCREFDLDETPELLAATRKKKGSNPILPNGIGAMGTKSARTSLLQSVGLVLAREGADLAAVEETNWMTAWFSTKIDIGKEISSLVAIYPSDDTSISPTASLMWIQALIWCPDRNQNLRVFAAFMIPWWRRTPKDQRLKERGSNKSVRKPRRMRDNQRVSGHAIFSHFSFIRLYGRPDICRQTSKQDAMPPATIPTNQTTLSSITRPNRKTTADKPLLSTSKTIEEHAKGTGIKTNITSLTAARKLLSTHGLTSPTAGNMLQSISAALFEFTITANLGATHSEILRAIAYLIYEVDKDIDTENIIAKIKALIGGPIALLDEKVDTFAETLDAHKTKLENTITEVRANLQTSTEGLGKVVENVTTTTANCRHSPNSAAGSDGPKTYATAVKTNIPPPLTK